MVRDLIGADAWHALVHALPPETKALIDKPLMPIAWQPDHHWNDIVALLAAGPFKGSPASFTELGRRQMHRDLSTLYKALMHLVSPETVIKKAATIYGTYTKNGQMSAKSIGKNRVEVRIDDLIEATTETWLYHVGSITGTLECTGAKNVSVKITEGGGRGRYCVYEATWS